MRSNEYVDLEDSGMSTTPNFLQSNVSNYVFYKNYGQIKTEGVQFYGMTYDGFVGFCQSSCLIMNLQGVIIDSYSIDSSFDFKLSGSGYQYQTHCFLGTRGTYLNIESFKAVRYSDCTSNVELISEYSSSGIILTLLNSDSPIEVSIDERSSFLIEGESIDIEYQNKLLVKTVRLESLHSSESIQSETSLSGQFRSALIEPLLFSTYFGGTGHDSSGSIDLDEDENIFVGGSVGSVIPYDYVIGSPGTSTDVAIMKLNALGSGVEWITYIGGTGRESASLVYFEDSIYVAGETTSTDFPIKNAFQSTNGGGTGFDAYLLRLNSTGNGLVFSSYLGGNEREEFIHIEVDPCGSLIIAGRSGSGDFPALNGFDMDKDATDDWYQNREVFVTKFNATGNMQFSTFLRGDSTGNSLVADLTTDNNGDIFITGITKETDFPCTAGCDFRTLTSSATFVSKICANGSTLIWSSLFGSSSTSSSDIAVMPDGSVYVAGVSESQEIPLVKPFDDVFNRYYPVDDHYESFIFRLSDTGDQILFSSYLGGDGNDFANAIYVDPTGYLYIIGQTSSVNFPRTFPYSLNSIQGDDIFILKFDWDLQRLLFSLTLPTRGTLISDLCIDSAGRVYVTGYAFYSGLPLVNPIQEKITEGEPDWIISIIRDLTDRDFDGLDDMEEEVVGTNVYNFDSDTDNTPDGWEIYYGLDPLNHTDAVDDLDYDTLTNLDEYLLGTDPSNPDSDFDNYTDAWEVTRGYNPMDPNSPSQEDLSPIPMAVILSTFVFASVVVIFIGRNRIRTSIQNIRSS